MRAIKFRVWDIRYKEMTYPDLFWFEEEGIREVPGDARGYEIMQFTGLTDKSGKDIYEGDIIAYLDNTSQGLIKKIVTITDIRHLPDFTCSKWQEIVGNIYEQPELLQKAGEA